MYVFMYVRIYVCMHVRTNVCIHVSRYMCRCVCINVCTYIYTLTKKRFGNKERSIESLHVFVFGYDTMLVSVD